VSWDSDGQINVPVRKIQLELTHSKNVLTNDKGFNDIHGNQCWLMRREKCVGDD
jgi:hypothetical protein